MAILWPRLQPFISLADDIGSCLIYLSKRFFPFSFLLVYTWSTWLLHSFWKNWYMYTSDLDHFNSFFPSTLSIPCSLIPLQIQKAYLSLSCIYFEFLILKKQALVCFNTALCSQGPSLCIQILQIYPSLRLHSSPWYMYITYIHTFICWLGYKLLTLFSYCILCFYKHGYAYITLPWWL